MNIDSFNLAAIDVGSNAARLLIKHINVDDNGQTEATKLLFLRIPLRLGMDVFANGRISEDREREFIATMKAYRQLMKVYSVNSYRACATSAMRDAKNGKAIINKIRDKAHIKLDIITGSEESKIIYDNHLSNISSEGCYLYVDVGGGSTELSFICDGERIYSHSFNIGTIRLLKEKVKREDILKMRSEINRITLGREDIKIIGSGGNINKLFRLASKKNSLSYLPVETLQEEYDTLSRLSVEERMAVYGLKPDRSRRGDIPSYRRQLTRRGDTRSKPWPCRRNNQ